MTVDPLLTRLKPFDIVAFKTAQSNGGSMSLNSAITAMQTGLTYNCPQCANDSGDSIGVVPAPGIASLIPCPTCQGYLKTELPIVSQCGRFTPLAISGSLAVAVSDTTQLIATVAGGAWVSASTGVATIDVKTGLVTGVSAGTSVITYTVNGVSNTATVTVS